MSAEQAANIIATVSPEGMVGRLVELTRENADLKAKLAQVEAAAATMREALHWLLLKDIDRAKELAEKALATSSGQRLLDEIEGLKRSVHASSKDIVRLETELSTLRATAQRRLELLKKCEWAWGGKVMESCPICGNQFESGHKPTCPLAQELKEGPK